MEVVPLGDLPKCCSTRSSLCKEALGACPAVVAVREGLKVGSSYLFREYFNRNSKVELGKSWEGQVMEEDN